MMGSYKNTQLYAKVRAVLFKIVCALLPGLKWAGSVGTRQCHVLQCANQDLTACDSCGVDCLCCWAIAIFNSCCEIFHLIQIGQLMYSLIVNESMCRMTVELKNHLCNTMQGFLAKQLGGYIFL